MGELRVAKLDGRGQERLHISGVLADKLVDRASCGGWLPESFQLVCFSTPVLGAKLTHGPVALPRELAERQPVEPVNDFVEDHLGDSRRDARQSRSAKRSRLDPRPGGPWVEGFFAA